MAIPSNEMEVMTAFQGLEVATHQPQNWHSTPQSPTQPPDVANAEVSSYYAPPILPKYDEQQLQNPSPAAVDLPVSGEKERDGRTWIPIAAIAAAAAAVIVGAALGGGLGSALSSCQKDLQSSRNAYFANPCQCTNGSTTPTLTTQTLASATTCLATFQTTAGGQIINYEAVPSKNVSTLGVDCDSVQKSLQVTSQGEKFSAYCNVGFEAGTGRTDGDGHSVTLAEITTLIAYSLSDCLEACSGYTSSSRQPGRNIDENCGSVVFKTNLAENYNANCVLLNSTITHNPGGGACDECISATRID